MSQQRAHQGHDSRRARDRHAALTEPVHDGPCCRPHGIDAESHEQAPRQKAGQEEDVRVDHRELSGDDDVHGPDPEHEPETGRMAPEHGPRPDEPARQPGDPEVLDELRAVEVAAQRQVRRRECETQLRERAERIGPESRERDGLRVRVQIEGRTAQRQPEELGGSDEEGGECQQECSRMPQDARRRHQHEEGIARREGQVREVCAERQPEDQRERHEHARAGCAITRDGHAIAPHEHQPQRQRHHERIRGVDLGDHRLRPEGRRRSEQQRCGGRRHRRQPEAAADQHEHPHARRGHDGGHEVHAVGRATERYEVREQEAEPRVERIAGRMRHAEPERVQRQLVAVARRIAESGGQRDDVESEAEDEYRRGELPVAHGGPQPQSAQPGPQRNVPHTCPGGHGPGNCGLHMMVPGLAHSAVGPTQTQTVVLLEKSLTRTGMH